MASMGWHASRFHCNRDPAVRPLGCQERFSREKDGIFLLHTRTETDETHRFEDRPNNDVIARRRGAFTTAAMETARPVVRAVPGIEPARRIESMVLTLSLLSLEKFAGVSFGEAKQQSGSEYWLREGVEQRLNFADRACDTLQII